MGRRVLTAILAAWGGLAVSCLLISLRGIGLQEVRWLHLWTGLQLLSLPFGLLLGLLLSLLAGPASVSRLRGVAFLAGAGIALVQDLIHLSASPAGRYPIGLAAVGLLCLGSLLWLRRSGEFPRAAVRLACASAWLLLAVPAGLLLPAAPPSLGALPDASAASRPLPAADAPNLVLVVLDTLRADRLGCYGGERSTTPNLDALARGGVLYRRAQSTATHTSASHATMFTGLLPSEHGVTSPLVGLPVDEPTLAGALAAAGWNTAGVTSNYVIRRHAGFGRGFHLYDDSLVVPGGLLAAVAWVADATGPGTVLGRLPLSLRGGAAKALRAALRTKTNLRAEQTNERALAALDALARQERPYFLFVNYMDVHAPYDPPAEQRARWLEHDAGEFRPGLDTNVFQNMLQDLERRVLAGEDHSERLAALTDLYDAELAHLDAMLPELWNRVLDGSRASGRPVLLIVTADHGEMFAEHGRMTHAQELYEECLHVPLILAGGAAPGVVDETVSTLDLPATLLAAAGLPPIGRSRDLRADPVRPAGHVLAEDGRAMTAAHFDALRAVAFYHGGRKGVFVVDEENRQFVPRESFDLAADPRERSPLGLEPLRGFLSWQNAWWERYLAGRAKFTGAGLSASDRDALAGLGYVEGQPH